MSVIERLILLGWVLGIYAWAVRTQATGPTSVRESTGDLLPPAGIDRRHPASW